MADKDTVTFVETDIDCLQCLADVRTSLAGTPWVVEVEVDVAAGCLVVRHHGDEEVLQDIVNQLGHRLLTGINGEVIMDAASVALPRMCPVGHHVAG